MSSLSVQQIITYDETLSARVAEFGADGFGRVIAWLLWAILVALVRVALSRHYLSDVLVGLVFGVLVSLFLQILVL